MSEIQHDLVRPALELLNLHGNLEIVSMADVPDGTGLGSSGSYLVGLLTALYEFKREKVPTQALAETACHIEMDMAAHPVGKHDHYLAAFGGMTTLDIHPDGRVHVSPLDISMSTTEELRAGTMLFYTGIRRSSQEILGAQKADTLRGDPTMVDSLDRTKALGLEIKAALETGNLDRYGDLLDEHWQNKKRRSSKVSDPRMDRWVRSRADVRRARRQDHGRGRRRIPDALLSAGGEGRRSTGPVGRRTARDALRLRLRGGESAGEFLMDRYVEQYLHEARAILDGLDRGAIEALVRLVLAVRERGGRIFFLGVGGGAGHASHAVNDFRKIAGVEAYAPTDNVSELTARINDEGWDTAVAQWLRGSRLGSADMVFVFSVGGGDAVRHVSTNLVRALELARERGAAIGGVVGRDGGFTAQVADACVIVPTVNPQTVTPHTESFQALVWHLIVSHPDLRAGAMKWESIR